MQELFTLLDAFRDQLESQIRIFRELNPILDREEDLIARFDLTDFEKVVVEKDQLSKRSAVIDERRSNTLRRICYLMSYDARGDQLPTLRTFRIILENYTQKVSNLIEAEALKTLHAKGAAFDETEYRFRELYALTAPRIYRNQQILKKLLTNFRMSISLLEREVMKSQNYDKSGKSVSKPSDSGTWSSLRVKV